MAKIVDLIYYKGDTKPFDVTVVDDDGNLVDISLATEIRFCIAPSAGAAPDFTKTQTGGDITLPGGGTDAVFRVSMADNPTAPLTAGMFHAEGDIVLGAVDETSIYGVFELRPTSLG